MLEKFSKVYELTNIDKTFAILGVILSLGLILCLTMVTDRAEYHLIGFLVLASCLLWLLVRKKTNSLDFCPSKLYLSFNNCAYLYILLFVLSILSIFCRPNLYERPFHYFVIVTLMVFILSYEIILSKKRNVSFLLLQIIALGINISWSQLLIFPGLIGVDPGYHSNLTSQIIQSQHLPEEGYSYAKFPLFHLIISAASLILDTEYKFAAMASVSLAQIICNALFIYLIAFGIFKSHKIGCLSSLLVVISNYHIFMSYWSIPNAFAGILIPIVFYLIYVLKERHEFKVCIFILLFLLTVIWTHTLTSMCVGLLLFVTWGISYVYSYCSGSKTGYIPLFLPIVFAIGMFAWWTYASNSIWMFSQLIKWGFSADFFISNPAKVVEYVSQTPVFERLFKYLGMYLFFSLSLVGILYMVSRKGTKVGFHMAFIALTPLLIVFTSNLLGFGLIEERWWYFSEILLSIPLAIAFAIIQNLSGHKRLLSMATPLFISLIAFLLIMSPPANADNHMFAEHSGVTHALTYSELRSSDFVRSQFITPVVLSDQIFYFAQKWEIPDLKDMSEELDSRNFMNYRASTILIREGIINKPMKLYSTIIKLEYNPNNLLSELPFQKVYNSKSVCIYLGNDAC